MCIFHLDEGYGLQPDMPLVKWSSFSIAMTNFVINSMVFPGHVNGLYSAASALYFSQSSYLGKILSATVTCQNLYET